MSAVPIDNTTNAAAGHKMPVTLDNFFRRLGPQPAALSAVTSNLPMPPASESANGMGEGHCKADTHATAALPARVRSTSKSRADTTMSPKSAMPATSTDAAGGGHVINASQSTSAFPAARTKRPRTISGLTPKTPVSGATDHAAAGHVDDDSQFSIASAAGTSGSQAESIPSSTTDVPAPLSAGGNGTGIVPLVAVSPGDDQQPGMATAVAALREFQVQRVAALRQKNRINNGCLSIVRWRLGWRWELPEPERKRISTAASDLMDALQSEGKTPVPDGYAQYVGSLEPHCIVYAMSRKPFDALLRRQEQKMERLAMSLPVWPWVESVKGLGALGLAIIVGEAGDLSNYRNPAKLWRRFGLAVLDGKAQRKCRDAAEAEKQGYNPRRRSAMWTIADSLLRQENVYSVLYAERRKYEYERNPEFYKGTRVKKASKRNPEPVEVAKVTKHCDLRARRYAEKRMVRDLWRAWRDAGQRQPA